MPPDPEPAVSFEVLTLFPQAILDFVGAGLLGKAIDRGRVAVHATNIRDFATDKHRTVDDTPFGGGAGMVIKAEPVVSALEAVEARRGKMHRILLTPSAPAFCQRDAQRLAAMPRIGLVCGRYEGIDDRVREHFIDECLSIGDFVLGGGEVAALVVIEAVARLCEGVLGNPDSVVAESFAADDRGRLLECPQYTRPAVFRGHAVPQVLLGGNHAAIEAWRHQASRRRTWALRPDLRHVDALGPDVPIHLAIDAAVPDLDLEAVGEIARDAKVTGLVRLGPPADPSAWIAATGGRVQTSAFEDLATLRKRLRRRTSRPARVVAVVSDAVDDPRVIREPGEVLDALGPGQDPVVLWLPASPEHALAERDGVAVFAPLPGPDRGPRSDGALATEPPIVDPSRPSAPAQRLAAALTLLRMHAADNR